MRIQRSKYVLILGFLMLLSLAASGRDPAFRAHGAQPPETSAENARSSFAGTGAPSETPLETESGEVVPPPDPEPIFPMQADSILADTIPAGRDTAGRKPFLEDIIKGKNQDSLRYDLRTRTVYIYEKGDVQYQKMAIQGDYMVINMETKEVFAKGRVDTTLKKSELWVDDPLADTLPKMTRVTFNEGSQSYTMDSMIYNLTSKKARVQGVATNQGEGFLLGERVKMMPDKTINISHGIFSTCDADHKHFYLFMGKSKTIPGKKTVFGPTYLVMEDVPIYFLGVPFGFFPMTETRKSGFIFPTFGEEARKGFFLRGAGYYFAINDYIDLAVTGGLYTQGAWEVQAASRYTKRYRYNGSVESNFSKDIIGEKGDADYSNMSNFNLKWTHAQDPKFKPNSTFTASVNFATSGYNKYASNNLNDYLSTQTNSSIAYTHTFAGTPIRLSTAFRHSQNARDSSINLTLPDIAINVSRITPFKRKNAVGRQRWYEKISFTYTGKLLNSMTVKEREIFTKDMLNQMKNGINHDIPVQTSFNILKYINVNPTFHYTENWFFKKVEKEWDPVTETAIDKDPEYGFYRIYNYNMNVSLTTKVYGTFQFKKKDGLIRAIRHMLTPSVSFRYAPNFGASNYGYYRQVQSSKEGALMTYSPFGSTVNAFSVPGNSQEANLQFSLAQTLEAKVRDRRDTSGMRKIKIIDNLSIGSSYNFLADSMNLSTFPISLRTTLYKNVALVLNATLDPYAIDENGKRYDRFMLRDGKLGRITSATTSFSYSFNSSNRSDQRPAVNDINSGMTIPPDQSNMFAQPGFEDLDPMTQRQLMSSRYYDFSIPWNLGLGYSFSYSKPGLESRVTQTLSFNGSISLTEKWGISLTSGFDIQAARISTTSISITRDLHCWQMSLQWMPMGYLQGWNFTIGIKSGMLKDIKYDRSRSHYDAVYDQ